jgi:phosphotransferase system  glucose/maltose/N-acetylglucosamine-specific IIC component
MNTSAIIFMVLAQAVITFITFSFLYRAMKAKKRPEPDSYEDNDDEA